MRRLLTILGLLGGMGFAQPGFGQQHVEVFVSDTLMTRSDTVWVRLRRLTPRGVIQANSRMDVSYNDLTRWLTDQGMVWKDLNLGQDLANTFDLTLVGSDQIRALAAYMPRKLNLGWEVVRRGTTDPHAPIEALTRRLIAQGKIRAEAAARAAGKTLGPILSLSEEPGANFPPTTLPGWQAYPQMNLRQQDMGKAFNLYLLQWMPLGMTLRLRFDCE